MAEYQRTIIKFTHEEVEALLGLFPESDLTPTEQAAKDKLKKIYARQILSHEKRQSYEESLNVGKFPE